jgi:hypothetical protein
MSQVQVLSGALKLNKIKTMIINLWYNKDMNQWRWTLTDPQTMDQHAGNQSDLRTAMNDVSNTVEYIVKSKQK